MKKLTLPMNVDTASPLALILVVGVFACREVKMAIISGWLVGFYAGPTYLAHQKATYGKGVVADGFSRQSADVLEARADLFRDGGLAIGAAEDDFPYQGLDAPVLLNAAHGQVVE